MSTRLKTALRFVWHNQLPSKLLPALFGNQLPSKLLPALFGNQLPSKLLPALFGNQLPLLVSPSARRAFSPEGLKLPSGPMGLCLSGSLRAPLARRATESACYPP
jgi:hypothetical protein